MISRLPFLIIVFPKEVIWVLKTPGSHFHLIQLLRESVSSQSWPKCAILVPRERVAEDVAPIS